MTLSREEDMKDVKTRLVHAIVGVIVEEGDESRLSEVVEEKLRDPEKSYFLDVIEVIA
jgi:hypothetical protein